MSGSPTGSNDGLETDDVPTSFFYPRAVGPDREYGVGTIMTLKAANRPPVYIEIIRQRAVGDHRRSQVVVARLVKGHLCGGDPKKSILPVGSELIAKFFDPKWAGNSVEHSNRAKNNEIESYKRLRHYQGSEIPIFYGKYEPSKWQMHSVEVLLLEFITDLSLNHFNPKKATSADIAALKFGAFSTLDRIHRKGVYHHDLARGNVFWNMQSKRFRII